MYLDKSVKNWLFIGIIMIFIMVMIGGITRLTESGLSIVDWNPIMGSIPPLNDTDWQTTFEKYKTSPQYIELNNHFGLAEFKSIFWWEFIHRQWGRLIGMVFFIPFIIFLIKKKISKKLLPKLLIVMFLGAFQGFLGWYMVKSGLVNEPRVSHYRLAAHLLTAFLTISYIFWIILEHSPKSKDSVYLSNFKSWSVSFLILLTVQILYGAFVAGLDAGTIFNTWPLMDGSFIHSSVTIMKPLWHNFIENRAGIQFVHRSLAILVAVYAFSMWFKARNEKMGKQQKKAVKIVATLVVFQFALGVFTLIFAVPISLGVLHQLGALLLLLASLYQLFLFKKPSTDY